MAKKFSNKEHAPMRNDSDDMVCGDCGQQECCCEGGSCGSCGPSGCGGSCGHGGMHGGWAHKKMLLGFSLIVLALLWYFKNVGTIPPHLFWPIVFALSGLALLLKGWWLKRQEDQCCGHC